MSSNKRAFFALLILSCSVSSALDLNTIYSKVKNSLSQSNSSFTQELPSMPANVLFSKLLENGNFKYDLIGDKLFVSNNKGVFEIDLKTTDQVPLKLKQGLDTEDYNVIYGTGNGVYAWKDDSIYYLTKTTSPLLVQKFDAPIRWGEATENFAVLITRSDQYGILFDGKFKLLGKAKTGDLRLVGDQIELRETSNSLSRVSRINHEGVTKECSVKSEVFRLAMTNDGAHAVGILIEGSNKNIGVVVGIDCDSHKITWRKKLHGEIMKRVQGIDRLFNPSVLSSLANCGDKICINGNDVQATYGGSTESGVYCLNPNTGSVDWEFSKVFNNEYSSTTNTNTIAPILCSNNKLLAFQNGDSVIYYQEFPIKIEAPQIYLSKSALDVLRKEVSDSNTVITNRLLLPRIKNGKLIFSTTSSKVVVIGN